MSREQHGDGSATPETIEKTHLHPRYKVFIHSDDSTPMGVVTQILVGIFSLKGPEAVDVMQEAHHKNVALVAAFSLEQAEFRVDQAHSIARGNGFPLKFHFEPE